MGGDSSWPSPNVMLPGIVAVAIAVVGYLTYEPALTSDRPPVRNIHTLPPPPTPVGFSGYYSRLWDDPLLPS